MNQKKIKALKKYLRQRGVDVNERVYEENGGVQSTPEFVGITGTISLRKDCGRAIYQTLKATQ